MNGFAIRKIKELCTDVVDCVNKTAPTAEGPTPFKMLRTTNVRAGWIDTRDVRWVNEEVFNRWTRRLLPKRGDVVLTREAPLGEVGMIRTDEPVFLGQRLVLYRADPQICDRRFLLYAMLGPDVQSELKRLGSGATVEHLRVPDCENLPILCPSLPTQRNIGSILGAIDDLIENNRRRIELLEQMAQSIYQEWFVNFRFPGYEEVALVDSSLGLTPDSWKIRSLDRISVLDRTSVHPKRSPDEPFDHYSIPAFDQDQLPVTQLGKEIKSGKFLLTEPAVLVSKLNPRFPRTWFVDPIEGRRSVASTEFLIIRPKVGFSLEFLYLLTRSDPFQARLQELSVGTSTSHQRAKPDDFLQIEIVEPPIELSDRLAEIVGPQLRIAQSLRLMVHNLNELRDLLLPKLVSGQIDLPFLDLDALVESVA